MKTHTVLAIGAHVGDAELTAGALLATCAVHGGKAVTLALTAGEKGAPIGADIAAYRADKVAQAEAFARDLGGEAYVLQYEDGLVPDNDEIRFAVCDIIRKVKPDIIVTHHAQSMHKDHAACHRIVVDAWFYAAIEGFQRELPKHFAKKLYFAENWEDAEGFRRYMWTIMITFTTATVFCALVPNGQDLRPAVMEHQNIAAWLLQNTYNLDTNTNVLPSVHVLGVVAGVAAAWHTPGLRKWGWRAGSMVLGAVIIASTLLVKQHAFIDVVAGLVVGAIAYVIIYVIIGGRRDRRMAAAGKEVPCGEHTDP